MSPEEKQKLRRAIESAIINLHEAEDTLKDLRRELAPWDSPGTAWERHDDPEQQP